MSFSSAGPGRPPIGTAVWVVGTIGRYAVRAKIPPAAGLLAGVGGIVPVVAGVVLSVGISLAVEVLTRKLLADAPGDQEGET